MRHIARWVFLAGISGLTLLGCDSVDDARLIPPQTLPTAQEMIEQNSRTLTANDLAAPSAPSNALPLLDIGAQRNGGYTADGVLAAGDEASSVAPVSSVASGDDARRQPINLVFRNESLRGVIDRLFRQYMHESFAFDPYFRDRNVSWTINGDYHPEELRQLIWEFIGLQGVDVRLQGNLYVFKNADAARSAATDAAQDMRAWRLDYLVADELIPILSQMIDIEKIHALPESNTLVVLGGGDDLARVDDLVKKLDNKELHRRGLLIYTPSFVSATGLVALLQNFSAQSELGKAKKTKSLDADVIPGTRRVVIITENPALKKAVRDYIARIDVPDVNQKQLFYYALTHQKAEDVQKTVGTVLPTLALDADEIKIVAHESTNGLLVTATPEQYYEIQNIIDRLDYSVPSMMVDVTIAEVQLENRLAYGVEWFLKGNAFDIQGDITTDLTNSGTVILDGAAGTASTPFRVGVVSLTDDPFATLELLNHESQVNILSRPRVLVKNNATATIKSTDEIRVLKSQLITSAQAGGSSLPQNEFEAREFGVVLRVTPKISDSGKVSMKIQVEDSRRGADETTSSTGTQPTFIARSVDTELVLDNGQTAMIGGLIQSERSNTSDRVPFFGDIPLLGNAFANQSNRDDRTELIVFLTPYIVHDSSTVQRVTEAFSGVTFRDGK